MRRTLALVIVGLVAFLSFLVAGAPAGTLLAAVDARNPGTLQWRHLSGTVLAGEGGDVVIDDRHFATVRWRWRPAAFLRGGLAYDLVLRDHDLDLSGRAQVDWRARFTLTDVSGHLPVERLAQELGQPALVEGRIELQLQRVEVDRGGRLKGAVGQIRLADARMSLGERAQLGSFRAELEPGPEPVQASLSDDGGPLELTGHLVLGSDGNYRLNGRLGLRTDAPPEVRRITVVMGQPDANGYWPFDIQGWFGS